MRQKVKSLEDTGRIAKKSNKQKKQKQEHTKEQNIRTDKERGKNTSAAFTCLSDLPKFGSRSSDFSQGRAKGNASC